MKGERAWLNWAMELQSIAQAGLHYSRDVFDIQRFERVREIAAEMVAEGSDMALDTVKDLFCCESGYQTPKLDCRGALFSGNRILLVQEADGRWALPGGWVDVNCSVKEGVEKEIREEAGLEAVACTVIAVQDREKHNQPPYAYGVCKIFVLCNAIGGEFRANEETIASEYFALDELPPLALEKTNSEQIAMCFDAYLSDSWKTMLD